jgi:hypothetical protein
LKYAVITFLIASCSASYGEITVGMIGVDGDGVGWTIKSSGFVVTEIVVGAGVGVIETCTLVKVGMGVVVGVITAVGAHATRITTRTSVNSK